MTQIVVDVPIFLEPEGNRKDEHWAISYKRHKTLKKAVGYVISPLTLSIPCSIKLTRYAPNLMDAHDNLPFSFKPIVDRIADKLIPGLAPGRADSDPRLTWKYKQVKSHEKKIQIIFEF